MLGRVNGELGDQRPQGGPPRRWKDVLAAVAAVIAASLVLAPATAAATPRLTGRVESGGTPLDGYEVTLYRTVPDGLPEVVGRDVTDSSGAFSIDNPDASDPTRVYYLLAHSPAPSEVVLASVLGAQPVAPATINPVTTVAFVYATAQFLDDGAVVGPVPGVPNGASMAANLADPVTGAVGSVLDTPPNGGDTSTLSTFNSLANVSAACVASSADCTALRAAATPAGGVMPGDSLQALRNVAREPTLGVDEVFAISETGPTPYSPARIVPPTAWTIAVRFDGGPDVPDVARMNGPGNLAMDEHGTMWVADNYTYAPPGQEACAGSIVLRFAPNGAYYPGSPYTGGGLSGVGYGIARDRYGQIWLSNFGFSATECAAQPPHNSLSLFGADGSVISPVEGYSSPGLNWPQGMTFSPAGTCG